MKNRFIILTIALLTLKSSGQDMNNCRVDFTIMQSKSKFDAEDREKEIILIKQNLPKNNFVPTSMKSISVIQKEWDEKIKDNKEYNKGNPFTKDSLDFIYSSLLYHNSYLEIYWKTYLGELDKDESKQIKKSKSNSLTGYISEIEYNFYLQALICEAKGQTFPECILKGFENNFESVEKALIVYNNIKTQNEIKLIVGNRKYLVKSKRISRYETVFVAGKSDTTIGASLRLFKTLWISNSGPMAVGDVPFDQRPIFDYRELDNKKIIIDRTYPDESRIKLKTEDNIEINLYNYFIKFDNSVNINNLVNIIYDKKRHEKVNELLNSLPNKDLMIDTDEGEFVKPKLNSFTFNFNSLSVNFTSNGKEYTKTFYPTKTTKYAIVDDTKKPTISELNFVFPIYNYECYNKTVQEFNNLKLKNDFITDAPLKNKMLNTLLSSREWTNYKVEKVILTEQSQWVIETNKYTGLKQSRYIFADVYYKNTKSGKCYLEKDVYFAQKLDPFNSVTYYMYCAMPQAGTIYPCNLK